jgi:hypothetical protein
MTIDIFDLDFRLNNANEFYYQISYHMILVQPQFNFAEYPNDHQTISIRIADAEYSMRELAFIPIAIDFSTLENNEICFAQNPIWSYLSSRYSSYVDEVYENSYAVFSMDVKRQADGVVIRLVLPMALLILLGTYDRYRTVVESRLVESRVE